MLDKYDNLKRRAKLSMLPYFDIIFRYYYGCLTFSFYQKYFL